MAKFDLVIDLTLDEDKNETTGDFTLSYTSDEEGSCVILAEQNTERDEEEQFQEQFVMVPHKKIKREIKAEDLMSYSHNSKYKMFTYNGLPSFDINTPLKPVEALDLLLNGQSEGSCVCTSKPIAVTRSATFVVARKSLGSTDDIKADDLGVWNHKGKPVRKYKVSRLVSGEVYGADLTSNDDDLAENIFQLTRIYYHHKYTPTFRRTIFFAKGINGNIPYVIIQYTFSDGVEIPIKMAPHGNSTKSKQPFLRTQCSTLESMKENIPGMSPKKVLNETYSKAGGLLQMSSSGEVGRNLRQIYNFKSSLGSTSSLTSKCDKDLVYDLLEQHYVSNKEFVRNVNFSDSVMSVVGTDQQFDDILRFCTSENMDYGSVLGIDPTFNLGDFFVTPTVYEHKLIKNKTTGKHPNFIGPTLIHQDRKFATYHYFASEIKKIRPALQALGSFGTDGEEALSSAFLSVFPRSTHLLCSLHKRDNITRKLRELKVDETKMKQILVDIFGSVIGDTHFQGLIDSSDSTDFGQKVELLRPKWESLCPGFVDWFLKHEADLMCSSMVASVRASAGLGNPPKSFTTNSNESLNNLLKRKVNFKRSEWPKFNEILLGFVNDQQAEFEKSIFGQGEYELVDEFKHLEVTHCDWIRMSAEQRKKKIEKACSVKLNFSALLSSMPEGIGTESKKCLSVSFHKAKVDHVSLQRLKTMWEKAEELLGTEGLILPAAGATNTARQVASLSALKTGKVEAPHYVCAVKHATGMELKCDFPVYRSSPNICQHALGAAEHLQVLSDYLLWVNRTKKSPNLSQLIASAVPKDGGQKPSTRRKGNPKQKKSVDTTVTRPLIPTSGDSSITSQKPLPLDNSHTVFDPSNPNVTSPGMSSHGFSVPPVLAQPGFMQPGFMQPRFMSNSFGYPSYQFPQTGWQFQPDAYHPISNFYSPITQCNISPTSPSSNDSSVKHFTVQWLTGTIRMCYGCASPIRTDITTIPEAPHDIIIRYKERRYYRDQATKSLKLTTKEENTYYHCMKTCILNKHPGFTSSLLVIPPELITSLHPCHKLHIYDNFGICL